MQLDVPIPLQSWLIHSIHGALQTEPAAVIDDQHLPALVPVRPGREWNDLLARLKSFPSAELAERFVFETDAIALKAGLFQWHDYLDEGHELSQSIEGEGKNQLGDYWHAIMHRREPDYANAKYWFRHVGRHPLFALLRVSARKILSSAPGPDSGRWCQRLITNAAWDPFAFVDLCEQCAANEETDLAQAARRIQQQEMALLIGLTYRQCVGIVG